MLIVIQRFQIYLACVSVLFFPLSASLAQAAEFAYTLADRPAVANYAPNPNYTYNAGFPVEITRISAGRYRVSFTGRVANLWGTVQVTAYGINPGYCNVLRWSNGNVDVGCFDGSGRPADRRFSILAAQEREAGARLAYAWLSNATLPSYIAPIDTRYGTGSFAVRRNSTGSYSVSLGGIVGLEAAVLATGYGGDVACNVESWSFGTANLSCFRPFDPASGLVFDSPLTVLAVDQGLERASFVWSSNRTGGNADPSYSQASDGSPQSVDRLSVGRYRVRIGPEASIGGNVQVSAYGSSASCRPTNYWREGIVSVYCTSAGVPVDSQFVVLALKRGGLTINRHSSVSLSDNDADSILRDASRVLQIDDDNGGSLDLACPTALYRSGAVSVFSETDGIIATVEEFDLVVNIPGDIKVVRELANCGARLNTSIIAVFLI